MTMERAIHVSYCFYWRSRRDLNPCHRRESRSRAKLQVLTRWGKVRQWSRPVRGFCHFDLCRLCPLLQVLAVKLSRCLGQLDGRGLRVLSLQTDIAPILYRFGSMLRRILALPLPAG